MMGSMTSSTKDSTTCAISFARRPASGRRHEGHVLLHGQLALAIERHQMMVARQKIVIAGPAEPDHPGAPQAGAVIGNEGLVEIEYRQRHQASS
jgi:hypothetical protein